MGQKSPTGPAGALLRDPDQLDISSDPGYRAEPPPHLLGLHVAGLEPRGDLLQSAFGRIGVDIPDHLELGFAETSDQFAGLVPRRPAITRRLDQSAASLRFVAQRGETLMAGIRQLPLDGGRQMRRLESAPCAWAWSARIVTAAAISDTIRRIIKGVSPARSCGPTSSDRSKVPIIGFYRLEPARNGTLTYA